MFRSFNNEKMFFSLRFLPIAAIVFILCFAGCGVSTTERQPFIFVETMAGKGGEIIEPFGVAARGGIVYVSDGQNGKIIRITSDGASSTFAEGLDTPSGLAFGPDGILIVADAGSHSIKSVDTDGKVAVIAGTDGRSGSKDGPALASTFNAPVGVVVHEDGRIFVADTYNDRIRVIERGEVKTLAGGETGYADGVGTEARFDTPAGITLLQDKLIVADTVNRRIRVVEFDGRVLTLTGNGNGEMKDGMLSNAEFVQPTALTADVDGGIFVADGNAIRRISLGPIPQVVTISDSSRGLRDGSAPRSRFNRPSGMAFDNIGSLVIADSENRLVRRFVTSQTPNPVTEMEIAALRDKPEEFRALAPARWPYDPPLVKRDIAGTLGEIRGEMQPDAEQVWFHNGLDIAGALGETARFIRDEKVLRIAAAENFGTLRELIRMPSLGYIHIRLGRSLSGETFGDERFQFTRDRSGKLVGVRVPRGTKFKAGEPIGTLNPMNHVHLIAGRSGSEMNAIDALSLPGISDTRPPVIEKVSVFEKGWREIETAAGNLRITVTDQIRLVVRAYDQMDGNPERRRLGVYRAGYQLLKADGTAIGEEKWNIRFDRLPESDAVRFVYANGSKSGATGETIFGYIVTNLVDGSVYREGFFDTAGLENGNYLIRVLAADYFGNTSHRDISIEVKK